MKKNKNLVTILFVIISIALAVYSIIFMHQNKSLDPETNDFKNYYIYPALLAAFMLVLLVEVLVKKEKVALVALFGFVATALYFIKKLYDVIQFNSAIFDTISPTENSDVITLLLFIGFIVCAIVSVVKNNKYTKFYVVGYFVLLIVSLFKILPDTVIDKGAREFGLVTLSIIAGYTALLVSFIPTIENKNETKEVEEVKEETNE